MRPVTAITMISKIPTAIKKEAISACPGLRLSSFSAKHSSALHHPLQLLEQRRHLGLGLSRTLAVIRLQTDFRDLFLQILAQNRRRICRRFRLRPVGLSHFLLVLPEPPQRIANRPTTP